MRMAHIANLSNLLKSGARLADGQHVHVQRLTRSRLPKRDGRCGHIERRHATRTGSLSTNAADAISSQLPAWITVSAGTAEAHWTDALYLNMEVVCTTLS